MQDWNLAPQDIERRSMEIIDEEAPAHAWPAPVWSIIRRMIHTTGDFSWVDTVRVHPAAVEQGMAAIREGRPIFTDTNMARAGISRRYLAPGNSPVECLINTPEVAEAAQRTGTTRAVAAVDLAVERLAGGIYVVGNAPTALFRLLEHMDAGRAQPALVVGLPVGFVNAAESKEALSKSSWPFITALGRKGGSAVAASVINALAKLCEEGDK
ncbi:MAG: precorrin-8X methylmutase [Deltaproteobacteria bacterium]|nr:precorrin-8X methylmutase [Deltaproteobacteria bacterium]